MIKRFVAISLVIILSLWLSVAGLPAQTAMAQGIIYVDDDNTDGPWNGTAADPYQCIQDGIDAAISGDWVQVLAGTYTEHITLKDGVIVQGAGSGSTTINGTGSGPVVTAISVFSTGLVDFTIKNGIADNGGGMYNEDSSPGVENCTFENNSAGYGGGMYNYDSSPEVTNCTFTGNSAGYGGLMSNADSVESITKLDSLAIVNGGISIGAGGGMCNSGGSSPEVTGCTFTDNWAGRGGGMYNFGGSSPEVTSCTFTGNLAFYGLEMHASVKSSPTVTNCALEIQPAQSGGSSAVYASSVSSITKLDGLAIINGTSAYSGGGMYNYDSSPEVTNCIFSGNSAGLDGGGMYNDNSSPTVTNCTFYGNSTSYDGGPVHNTTSSSPTVTKCSLSVSIANYGGGMCNKNGSIPLVRNCIISGNTANVGGGIYTDCPHLIDYNDVCCNFPDNYSGGCFPGTNDITPPKDPMFADPFGGDYHLQGGSPCIDTGDNGAVPPGVTTDRDGNTRILDGNGDATARVDMGAYEYVCLDEDGDNWTTCKGDCDDADATVYPYAPEICDGKDNNCDGNIPANEGDTDGDGTLDCADGCLNDPDKTEPGDCGCGIPDTDSDDDGSPSCFDCDDNDPNNWPGNMEICDGQDNNCDGQVDEGCAVEEADLRCVQYRFGAPAPGYSFAGWPIFEGWLDVRIENNGAGDAFNVTAEVMGWPANVTVPDATVYVGNIPAGESAWSTAPDPSFTTRVNMAEPADPNEGVFWRIGYDDADGVHHVVENVPQFPS